MVIFVHGKQTYPLTSNITPEIRFFWHDLWRATRVAVGMQSGVCFGMETNLSTGERLVFLIGTNVSRRQKNVFFQAETIFFGVVQAWDWKQWKEKTNVFLQKLENVSFRARNKPLLETLVWNWKLKTNSVGTSLKRSKTNLFSTN